jgi:hypothetical protein
MKDVIRIIAWLLFSLSLFGQQQIDGRVLDKSGNGIPGASVYLEGTYDGTFTDSLGQFRFTTHATDTQQLIIEFMGFRTEHRKQSVSTMQDLKVILRPATNTMQAVEVTASTFTAGDNGKMAVLKPLDIVTTPGSMGDVIGALQTLPGNQSNAEDGRLFVRGGDAEETAIYVDGMKVFTPYTRTISGTPVRGRFSPFLFQGVRFNSGGYSAAYGQALSGILDMKTIDEVDADETNISLMTLGAGLGHTKKRKNQSLSLNSSYINFTPYLWLYPGRLENVRPFQGLSGEAIYRRQMKNARWKTYVSGDQGQFAVDRPNINTGRNERLRVNNKNVYANSTLTAFLNETTSLFTGLSAGWNNDYFHIDARTIQTGLTGGQYRLALTKVWGDQWVWDMGAEHLFERHSIQTRKDDQTRFSNVYDVHLTSAFSEAQYHLNAQWAMKTGLRMEYHHALQQAYALPRFTLAHKFHSAAQLSLAYGRFSQNPLPEYKHAQTALDQARGEHFLLNLNYKTKTHLLRAEGYYKNYDRLVRYPSQDEIFRADNSGEGFAYGADFFWRANNWIQNMDFWVSYGWLHSERNHQDFPEWARPRFATAHNLSVVSKIWIPQLTSQLGLTYQFASGRPYHNPNRDGFMQFQSSPYHMVNMSWSYLITQQKILFISVQNVPNIQNEFGQRFGSERNEQGLFPSQRILPNFDQMFFVGFFWTISSDKEKNQLDRL